MNFLQQSLKGYNNWWRYVIIASVFLTPFLSGALKEYVVTPLLSYASDSVSLQISVKQLRYVILLGLFFALFRFLHKRDIKTLITYRKKFDYLRFALGFTVWGVLLILIFTINVFMNPELYKWNFQLMPFLKLFFFLLLLLPFQIFFMAFFFNSYLLQMFNALFRKPWVSLVVVIVFFTVLRFIGDSKGIATFGYKIFFYHLALSILFYLIIVLDDGTEIILGVLLVSTLVSRLFITYTTNKTQLDSIFIKEGSRDMSLFSYVIPFICCPLFFIILFKVYKWTNWREKLFNTTERI